MGQHDDLIATITYIHAAALDVEQWPEALRRMTNLVGGLGASLEFLKRPPMRHQAMYAYGPQSVDRYTEYYARLSPRLPHALRQPGGVLLSDGQYYDDADIDADPFYMEFLKVQDMRYFVGGVISATPRDWIGATVQFSPRQGHPDTSKMRVMSALLPHFRQAVDVMRRLGHLAKSRSAFERTLDWLTDGVLLISGDAVVRYANASAQAMLRARDGIVVRRGALKFEARGAAANFDAAMRCLATQSDTTAGAAAPLDFAVERKRDAPPYQISIRTLAANQTK